MADQVLLALDYVALLQHSSIVHSPLSFLCADEGSMVMSRKKEKAYALKIMMINRQQMHHSIHHEK